MKRQTPEAGLDRGKSFYELSPTEQAGIYELERDDVGRHDTFAIMGAFLGVKSFSWIPLYAEGPEKLATQIKKREDIFSLLGLKSIQSRSQEDEYEKADLIFGRENVPDSAKKFFTTSALNTTDLAAYHRELGALMGVPQTAIEAFIARQTKGDTADTTFPDAVPQADRDSVEGFVWFHFSETHWKEELAMVQGFAAKVKEISPLLFSRISGKRSLQT